MKITIEEDKLWDFVRDAYEEGKEHGARDAMNLPTPVSALRPERWWGVSESKTQVQQHLAAYWAEAREMLED